MSDTADPELCYLITIVCKSSKNFDFPETEQPFRFISFEEFSWIFYSWSEDATYCLPCVSFSHKNVGKSLQKTISNMANNSKNILNMTNNSKNMKKALKCSNGNTRKEINITS